MWTSVLVMAQEFVVLQCCQCRTYQVQQSKKATKWLCKMCNQKQSFKQFFGRGSAKDCRLVVQTLNRQRFEPQAIEGVLIDVNDSNTNTNIDDSEILDMILAKEDNCDSSDDMSLPKKKKTDEDVDIENIESNNGFESKKNSWNNYNQTVGRRVRR